MNVAGASRGDRGIVVIGGGIVGLSAAYFLARRGARVVVLEREKVTEGASAGNAGILAAGHPPLPRPGLFRRILRLLADRTSPLYIEPRADPALARWLGAFLLACRTARFRRSLRLLATLGRPAADCFRRLVEEEAIDCEYHASGWLEVFRTERALAGERETAGLLRQWGYRVEECSGDELRRKDRAFRRSVVGALHYTDSAFANPGRFMEGLAERAAARGVSLRQGAEATRIVVRRGRLAGVELASGEYLDAGAAVLAAGAWTSEVARRIGIRVPMQAGKGYHLQLRGLPVRPETTCVLAETFVAATPIEDGLRLAGTVELAGVDRSVTRPRLKALRTGARGYLRGIDRAEIVSSWCGLRPLTADGLPVIGRPRKARDVVIATGHAMMGFLLGPLSGRLVSEILLDGRPSLEIAALDVNRF